MRSTVDFGFDLGTTNSEVACCTEGKVNIFKNYLGIEHSPSVVRLTNDQIIVGRKAYERLIDDKANTCGGFKRWMGTQQKMSFLEAQRQLSPEEMSAEVLKSLKGDVQRAFGEDVRASVITVPAMFETVQSEATVRAGHLAGIEQVLLLQEPIAASIAYGYESKPPSGLWMVYDLGGGTFDVSLLAVRDARLTVIGNAGDNWLGGIDLDWEIIQCVFRSMAMDIPLASRW